MLKINGMYSVIMNTHVIAVADWKTHLKCSPPDVTDQYLRFNALVELIFCIFIHSLDV